MTRFKGAAVILLCGMGLLGAATPARPPSLSVTPNSLTFNAPQFGPNPLPQQVTILNNGTGLLQWTATDDQPWLSLAPASGQLATAQSQLMTVQVDVTGLAPGPYTGTITVSDPGAAGSPQTVSVTLNVSALPRIGLSPTSLTFNAPFNPPVGGPNPASQTVTISNSGGGTLNWTAADGATTWLDESPPSGSLSAGASQGMSVSVDATGLAVGTYTGTITVSATGATNSPQTVSVTLNVSASPTIGLSPTSLTFNAPVGGPNPAPQTVTVSNTGGGTLNWSAANGETWLSESPPSGTLSAGGSAPISVSVDVTGLAAGTYTGTITVSAAGATNDPQTVSVTLNVSGSPAIGLSPTSLTFNAPVGGPNPSSQTVTVSNTGGGMLNWSAADGETWLAESPASGSLSAGGSEGMSILVNVTGLAAGTYTGTISVSAPGASNTPQTISVTLNVSNSPTIGLSPTSLSFFAPVGGPNPLSQTVTVSNTGGGTLTWSAADGATWLSESPASGSLAAGAGEPMTVSVDVTPLAAGTYTGSITVSAAGATNTPQTVSVTLTVSSSPLIALNPTSLSFSAPQGGGNPPGQPVSVTNAGAGTLNWSASASAGWAAISPASGSLAPVQSEPFTVTINASGLAPGTYTTTLTVSDAGAVNSPQTVFVTLSVPPPLPANKRKAGFNDCGLGGPELAALILCLLYRRRSRRVGGIR